MIICSSNPTLTMISILLQLDTQHAKKSMNHGNGLFWRTLKPTHAASRTKGLFLSPDFVCRIFLTNVWNPYNIFDYPPKFSIALPCHVYGWCSSGLLPKLGFYRGFKGYDGLGEGVLVNATKKSGKIPKNYH